MPVVCRCVRVRGLCLCVYKPVYVREEVCLCKCVHVQAGVCMGGACPCVGNCVCVCVCEGGREGAVTGLEHSPLEQSQVRH